MIKLFKGIVIGIFLFALVSIAWAGTKELKVGCSLSLTGPAAGLMIPVEKGIKLQAERINEKGGIKVGKDNYLIKLIIEDDAWKAAVGRAAAEKLVYRDKVKFILGAWCSTATQAMASITEPNKVLNLIGSYSVKSIGTSLKYKFRVLSTPGEMAVPVATWLVKAHPEIKRVAIVGENNEFGWSSASDYQYGFKEAGLEIVAREYHPVGMTDFSPFLTRVLAKNPQMIEMNSPTQSVALIIKQSREMGYKGLLMSSIHNNSSELLSVAGPKFCEGYIDCWANVTATDKIKEYVARYKKKYGRWEGGAVIGWNYLPVLVQAIEKAQSIDPTVVRDVMANMGFDCLEGRAIWGGQARYGCKRQLLTPIFICDLHNGEERFLSMSPGEEPPPQRKK